MLVSIRLGVLVVFLAALGLVSCRSLAALHLGRLLGAQHSNIQPLGPALSEDRQWSKSV
jgi:hypothetical protein